MRLCPTDDRGFTLIETLTAIFIFSLLTVSCNAIFSLIKKNAIAQTQHNHTTQIRQRAVTLLVADLLQAEISAESPITLFPRQQSCRKTLRLYTKNLSNPENHYGNRLHQVTWTFSDQGVMRTALLEQGQDAIKMLPGASCLDFSVYQVSSWQRPDILEKKPAGFAFNLIISPSFHIERFIPMGAGTESEDGNK